MLLLVILLVNLVSGDVSKETPYVTGGTETAWGAFPSAVVLDGPNQFCGGTVIHPSHVITAASCVLNENFEVINPNWFSVYGGDIFFSPASSRRQTRQVSQIFVHREFNPFTGENGIALLRVSFLVISTNKKG
jgi:secreted trypsin-like serine protease